MKNDTVQSTNLRCGYIKTRETQLAKRNACYLLGFFIRIL